MLQYLTDDQIRTRLKLGKSVEQWLGDEQEVYKRYFFSMEEFLNNTDKVMMGFRQT